MRFHLFLSRTSGTLQADLTVCIIIVERSVGEMAYGVFKQHCFCCCCCFLMYDLWLQTMHGPVLPPPPSPEKNAFVRLKASDNSGLVAAVNPRQLRWHIDSLIGATGRRQTPHSPLSGLSLIHKLRPRGEKRKRVLLPASREAWPRRPFSKTAARLSAAITLVTSLPHRQSSTLMMRRLTCNLQVPASYLRGGLSRVKTVRTSKVYWDF